MSKKNETTSTALVTLNADTNIPDVLSALDKAIAELKDIETTPWKTGNGTMTGFPNSVKEEKLIPNLIRMMSSISERTRAYNAAAEKLGLNNYPVFSDNGTEEDWEHDIKLRIKIVNQKERLDKLKEFKTKAEKFLSEQDQKAMLFNEMAKFLKA